MISKESFLSFVGGIVAAVAGARQVAHDDDIPPPPPSQPPPCITTQGPSTRILLFGGITVALCSAFASALMTWLLTAPTETLLNAAHHDPPLRNNTFCHVAMTALQILAGMLQPLAGLVNWTKAKLSAVVVTDSNGGDVRIRSANVQDQASVALEELFDSEKANKKPDKKSDQKVAVKEEEDADWVWEK